MNFEKDSRFPRYRLKGDGIVRIFFTALISMVVVFTVFVSSSLALPIYGNSTTGATEGIGSFEGEITYDPNKAELTVELTNTSDKSNGGYITGFAFNNPDERIEEVIFSGPDFDLIGDTENTKKKKKADPFDNSIKASPFGFFDIGAALGGDWLGGGSPQDGIGVGATKTFTFHLEGIGLSQLTTENFINELSDSKKESSFFAVRFKGFNNDGSDKVVPGVPDLVVPEPSTILLLGFGLIGILGLTRKFSKR